MKKSSGGAQVSSILALLAAGCGAGPVDPIGNLQTPSQACVDRPVTQLAVGEHVILDPGATSGCLRLPVAGSGGAQYALVLASTNGTRSSSGIQGSYLLRSSNPVVVVTSPAPAAAASPAAGELAARFDATLRDRERVLAADPRNRPVPFSAPGVAAVPPPLGDVKSFKVCSNLQCSAFATVQATARFVGEHVAVYHDNQVPQSSPFQDSDFASLGTAFDQYHYPIDTTAFGRESDIDGNGVVILLMTDAVNDLTPDCSNGRVVGFFFGGDLLNGANSNRAEIFYTLVPSPATSSCSAVTRTTAVNNLKPTLIHEFQHMISFNQRVLLRAGTSEETWLNEALSHFAEELGGRLIPDAECTPSGFSSCRAQYTGGDILDAYDYLKDTEAHYLVFPSSEQGTLAQRGAVWLFLRWALDQFASEPILATAETRALVATTRTGSANLTAVTGGDFSQMVPRWLLAIYLDDGPDLPVEPTGLLQYTSWGLRGIWTDPRNAQIFTVGFPLVPQSISGTFSRSGTLRAGSGKHFLIVQAGNGDAVDMQVLRNTAGTQLDPALMARFGIVRIR